MGDSALIKVGVILAREEVDHPWQDHRWRAVSIIPHAPEVSGWTRLASGEGWSHYHVATVQLELFSKDTSAYQVNLQNREPVIYIVLHDSEDEEDEYPFYVHIVTASAFEAQDYLDSGEEIVEIVAMPNNIQSWIAEFIDEHHEEEKFHKRQRDEVDIEEHKFGQEPIFEVKDRLKRSNGNG